MNVDHWELVESLQRMCALAEALFIYKWTFKFFLCSTMQSNEQSTCFFVTFSDIIKLYTFQHHAREKIDPVLIHVYTRELTFNHTGVLWSYFIRSFKRLYLNCTCKKYYSMPSSDHCTCTWLNTPLLFLLIDKQYHNHINLKWEASNFIHFKIPFFFYVFREGMNSHGSVTSPAAPYT